MNRIYLYTFALLALSLMYAVALYTTKEQRAYLAQPTQDELMARDCRMTLTEFYAYNGDILEEWEQGYGKGFTVYIALRSLEAARLPYGKHPTLKGWHEYNASRQKEKAAGD